MISHLEIPVTPEEEEAWTLFLKKYENLNFGEENRKKWDNFQSEEVVKSIIGE